MRPDWISAGGVGLLTIVWGSAFALTKLTLEAFSPIEIALGRIWLSTLVLIAVARLLDLPLPRDRRFWGFACLLGLLSQAAPFVLLAWGQQHVPSNIAAIFVAGAPLFVLLLARVMLAEPVGPRKWAGFAVGLGGLTMLLGPAALAQLGRTNVLGQLACLLAAFSYAGSAIVVMRMPKDVHAVTAINGAQLCACVLTLPLLGMVTPQVPPLGVPLAALVVLGLIQTGVAQVLRFYTLQRAGPIFVSIVGYLIPIWAGTLSVAFLGEVLTLRAAGAYGLILAGLLLARPRSKARNAGS